MSEKKLDNHAAAAPEAVAETTAAKAPAEAVAASEVTAEAPAETEPEATEVPEEEPAAAEDTPAEPAVSETAPDAKPDTPDTEDVPEESAAAEPPADAEDEPAAEETPETEDEPETETETESGAGEFVFATEQEDAPDEDAEEISDKTDNEIEKEVFADDTEELPPIDEKRLLDMTRTVQLSVEQILANAEANAEDSGSRSDPADPEEDAHAEDDDDSDAPATVGEAVRSGVTGMAKWLLLVVFFILVVAGFGVAYLYRSATPDMLPALRATFAGQTLEPSAYKWHVPVVGNWFKRTYAETYSSAPTVLEDPISELSPDIKLSSTDYATKLTITDEEKEVIFEGTVAEFSSFCFTDTGTYTAKLVASATGTKAAGSAEVTGSETWLFTFDIAIEPSIYLSESTIAQGSVAAIRVTGSYETEAPTLTTTLDNDGFIESANGWVCYLPIPWNAPLGTETITVQVGRYSYDLYLKITDGNFSYKDYSSKSQRATPYIGQGDAPSKVKQLFTQTPAAIAWADAGFVQPFLNRLNTRLDYGTTEYVGRSYSERGSNTGAGGRTSTNIIASTTRGELLIAPASGKIALAEDLGDDYGYTLVIDHGAGVRTIVYGLADLEVKAGQQVKQGQTLATCTRTTVVEMRVGTVPIDPVSVWRGQCNGLKYY